MDQIGNPQFHLKKISNKEEQTDIHSLRTKDGRDIQFSQSLLFVIQIHIIKMKLSDYTISKPPRELSLLFNELIITRTHKRFIVEKPELKRIAVDIGQSLKKRPSSVFSYNVDHNEQPLPRLIPICPAQVKTKIIQKVFVNRYSSQEQQRKLQTKHSKWLLNFLHTTNRMLIRKRIPPGLSILQTLDEGDYVEGDNNWYEKKDYPHYSNAIKLVELPKPVQSVVDIEPMKTQCDCFTVEDNTIFKVGKVYEVVDALFKQSINYCNHLKKSLLTSSSYLREVANENYDLKVIADELNISFVTVKLVLEVLDNYYDLSMRIKGEEQKVKLCQEIIASLKEALAGRTQSAYIPAEERYSSLRDLKESLRNHLLDD